MNEPIASVRSRAVPRLVVGRGRLLPLLVLAGLVSIAAISVWRMRDPDALPDVGDPFDLAEARRPIVIPDPDNAYVAYAEAHQKLTRFPPALEDAAWDDKNDALIWSGADSIIRAYLEKNRAALEIWRQGSQRPDALYYQPALITSDSILPLIQDAIPLAGLAAVEASRHEEKGDMDEAWIWYRATLRASRLVGRHGVLVQRHRGARIHALAARRIVRWAADPRVGAKLLRQAMDETLAADALTSSVSEALKISYLIELRELDELSSHEIRALPMPGGRGGWLDRVVTPPALRTSFQQFRLRSSNDPEKTRRAIRLVFANWLAQVDRPASKRARIAIPLPTLIYSADPTAPPAASAVEPEQLIEAIGNTTLGRLMLLPDDASRDWWAHLSWEGDGPLAREPRRRAVLIVKLAAELYRREHGAPPASAGVLVGPYLKALPEGIHPSEPIPVGID
jgi:hypothetical protein